ncbi:MAG TPA: IS110 family transposase [Promineifilum sp.]
MNQLALQDSVSVAAFVALDWGDRKHAGRLSTDGQTSESFELEQSAEALDLWVAGLRKRFGGAPIAVALEQSKGALIYALLKYDLFLLYPVNPKQLARFREALAPSGAKDDPADAALLLELLLKHRDHLRLWRPDDPITRLIGQLAEDRRHLVENRTRLVNALKSRLKQYFPLALQVLGELDTELACRFLSRWPSLEELQQEAPEAIAAFYRAGHCHHPQLIAQRLEKIAAATPLVTDSAILQSGRMMVRSLVAQLLSLIEPIENYDLQLVKLMEQHADAGIFRSFPGAGAALAPRLLAAFGTDRSRLEDAGQVQAYSGIAPVLVRSGATRQVRRRWACNKFLRQTFHEFAGHSLRHSAWAQAYYDQMRARGVKHQAAVRALAFKWIRILFRCWQSRTLYNEVHYFQQLYQKQSPMLKALAPAP